MSTSRAPIITGVLAAALVVGIAALFPALAGAPKRAATAPPPPPLTIAIDGGYMGWSETEIEERAKLGVAVTRHEWQLEEPVNAQDDVMEDAAGEIGTRVHALLGANQIPDPAFYRQWVLAFIDRYGRGGSFWNEHPEYNAARFAVTSIELGNEPYTGVMTAGEYADAVEPTLRAIEARELPITVVVPSRVYESDTAWIDRLYARIPNLNDLVDGFAAHPYWYGQSPAAAGSSGPLGWIETLRRRMDRHDAEGKTIWVTEYGQSTAACGAECVTEEAQAQHLQQMLTAIELNPEWRVRMISFFQLRDRATHEGDREREFGLLREDGSPKPAYHVVRAAVQAFR